MATEANEIKVDTNVSLDLHPANIDRIAEQHGDEVAPYLAPVRGWFDAAYNSLSDIHAAKAKGLADKTQTQASVIVKLASSAAKVEDQLLKRGEALFNTLTTQINTLNQSLDAPLSQTANRGTVSSEIRQHFKSMGRNKDGIDGPGAAGKRLSDLREAITSGDAEVAGSILGAPGMLSGISEEMRKLMTREWNSRANPIISKRVDALTAARDRLEQRLPLIMSQVTKSLGADWAQVNALKNASSEFEKSLIINRFLPANGTEG